MHVAHGATSLLTTFDENEPGVAFAAAAGSERCVPRRTRASTRAPSANARRRGRPAAGRGCRSGPRLHGRPGGDAGHSVHRADRTSCRTTTGDNTCSSIHCSRREGSFVAMVDGVAAAVSLILVDDNGRATSMFTGTLRGYRGRGLALAVKLGSIEWAAGARCDATVHDQRRAQRADARDQPTGSASSPRADASSTSERERLLRQRRQHLGRDPDRASSRTAPSSGSCRRGA